VVETTPDFEDMNQAKRKCFLNNEDPFKDDPLQYYEVISVFSLLFR
jgi:hypothetical protein